MNKKTLTSIIATTTIITILSLTIISQNIAYNNLQYEYDHDLNILVNRHVENIEMFHKVNQTVTNLQSALDNKTQDYYHLKDVFAIYCNKTTIPLDETWSEHRITPYLVSDRPQNINLITYVNGTHAVARLYFIDQNVWSPAVFLGTYEECNID